jgi:hypothetical protein
MKPFSEMPEDELAKALTALRPEPSPTFAAELDERAAAGFPRRSPGDGRGPNRFARLAAWLGEHLSPKTLIPVAGVALIAVVVVSAVISSSGGNNTDAGAFRSEAMGGREGGGAAVDSAPAETAEGEMEAAEEGGPGYAEEAMPAPKAAAKAAPEQAQASPFPPGTQFEPDVPRNGGAAADTRNRDIEKGASITLGTKPGEVGEASNKVFDTVHAYNGIVLNSETTNGSGTDAEAHFELLIPSARFDDAMAAFSKIGEVRSRHESTQDITAPTVGTSEKLQDSNARIDGLLAQLSEATTDSEREAVEAELRSERNHAANLKANLNDLKRRANLSRVELRIQSGRGAVSPEEDEGSSWGVGQAFDDAGHLLAVAAGVAIIALAVLAPLALVLFLVWLAGRSFTRRARERALT